MIGQVVLAQLAPEYGSEVVIGQQREKNVVRSLAAVSGEERCVTTIKTAAKETTGYPRIEGLEKSTQLF